MPVHVVSDLTMHPSVNLSNSGTHPNDATYDGNTQPVNISQYLEKDNQTTSDKYNKTTGNNETLYTSNKKTKPEHYIHGQIESHDVDEPIVPHNRLHSFKSEYDSLGEQLAREREDLALHRKRLHDRTPRSSGQSNNGTWKYKNTSIHNDVEYKHPDLQHHANEVYDDNATDDNDVYTDNVVDENDEDDNEDEDDDDDDDLDDDELDELLGIDFVNRRTARRTTTKMRPRKIPKRQYSNEYHIKRLLLKNYDITTRPVINDSTTTTVIVGMSLYHILDTVSRCISHKFNRNVTTNNLAWELKAIVI